MKSYQVWLGGSVIGLCGLMAVLAYGQLQVEPDQQVRRQAYRVRVINEMEIPICVKIIPYNRNTYFHADLGRGKSETQDLYGGQRAVCVWDDKTGDLILVSGVDINQNGKLRIQALQSAAGEPEPGGENRPARAAPKTVPLLGIERE